MSRDDFDRVVRTHGAAIERLAWGYATDRSDHDDLLQEILVAVWRSLPFLRGECSERTYVLRIARNRSITHSLRRRARRTAPLDDALHVVDSTPDLHAQLDHEQRAIRLRDGIRRLADPYRETVLLHLEGLTHQEIADLQGTTSNNVAVRLVRARTMLRQLLGEEAT